MLKLIDVLKKKGGRGDKSVLTPAILQIHCYQLSLTSFRAASELNKSRYRPFECRLITPMMRIIISSIIIWMINGNTTVASVFHFICGSIHSTVLLKVVPQLNQCGMGFAFNLPLSLPSRHQASCRLSILGK